jgi:hypothetical protein
MAEFGAESIQDCISETKMILSLKEIKYFEQSSYLKQACVEKPCHTGGGVSQAKRAERSGLP